MKNKLILTLYALTFGLTAYANESVQLDDLVKHSNGKIRLVNQADAARYCVTGYTRLPTARQFADLAQISGARGIKEVNQFASEADANRAGYHLFRVKDGTSSEIDSFYFSNIGYLGPIEYYSTTWSSSEKLEDPLFAFAFDTATGDFKVLPVSSHYPFRCIQKH